MLVPVALFAALIVTQQSPAAPQATAPVEATTPAPETTTLPTVKVSGTTAEPTQVCRMEPVTGSRFGRRVCRSSVQTAEEAAESREMLRRMQGSRMPDGG